MKENKNNVEFHAHEPRDRRPPFQGSGTSSSGTTTITQNETKTSCGHHSNEMKIKKEGKHW